MKQSIHLRLGQHLTITPQLQHAIKLLQLSTLELQREIQEVLESNFMLEEAEEGEHADTPEEQSGEVDRADQETSATAASSESDREINTERAEMPDDLPVDTEWSDVYDSYLPASGQSADDEPDIFAQRSRPQSLHDHLEWQLNLARFNEREHIIAAAVIDAINPDGYLAADTEELLTAVDDPELDASEIEAVIHRIQSFDPPGIAARNLQECLLLQLRQLPEDLPFRDQAILTCRDHFQALSRHDLNGIAATLGLDLDGMAQIVALIRGLQPRPGALIMEIQPEYVIPDVIVRKRDGAWLVELNPDLTPKLRVNADYAKLIRRADQSADNTRLKSHLQEARWFIKSLASRNETVLRAASKIVELQRDFLEQGEEAMKPMVLRDVAEALELHESTISRVTTQKYMHTPRGTFELKYFFSSHVSTASGGECSSTAIRALIRKLVAAEAANKPLSDNKIAKLLSEQGINVARRTVAKYREGLSIPPSNERKRLTC
ncbi:RNA polymerase sigma-54 factor [Thioflavicoccus mobilis 8321]|uniref:RNA polymerase sigma-54 factor n=1 Tax=Thioflavicoccus mobilis 8321 TaxID=765912 RepID=L0GZU8_9GAMM|nr:RNA polymerase factor sigma-54 [Thioflavicoccus mobilis]AGA91471.1 RNA polymerase sigma-54 factor [Thioflavicoccus mobilis 8321]